MQKNYFHEILEIIFENFLLNLVEIFLFIQLSAFCRRKLLANLINHYA